jgi:hypothetical protein
MPVLPAKAGIQWHSLSWLCSFIHADARRRFTISANSTRDINIRLPCRQTQNRSSRLLRSSEGGHRAKYAHLRQETCFSYCLSRVAPGFRPASFCHVASLLVPGLSCAPPNPKTGNPEPPRELCAPKRGICFSYCLSSVAGPSRFLHPGGRRAPAPTSRNSPLLEGRFPRIREHSGRRTESVGDGNSRFTGTYVSIQNRKLGCVGFRKCKIVIPRRMKCINNDAR